MRISSIYGRDRQVVIGSRIVKQYFDPIVSVFYIFCDVETPGRCQLYPDFLFVYPNFGCGDNLSQIQVYFIIGTLFQADIFPVPGTAGIGRKTFYLCLVSCRYQSVSADLPDRSVNSGTSGIAPRLFYRYGYRRYASGRVGYGCLVTCQAVRTSLFHSQITQAAVCPYLGFTES